MSVRDWEENVTPKCYEVTRKEGGKANSSKKQEDMGSSQTTPAGLSLWHQPFLWQQEKAWPKLQEVPEATRSLGLHNMGRGKLQMGSRKVLAKHYGLEISPSLHWSGSRHKMKMCSCNQITP